MSSQENRTLHTELEVAPICAGRSVVRLAPSTQAQSQQIEVLRQQAGLLTGWTVTSSNLPSLRSTSRLQVQLLRDGHMAGTKVLTFSCVIWQGGMDT